MMDRRNNQARNFSKFFNFIFFSTIIAVIAVSLYIVFINAPTRGSGLELTVGQGESEPNTDHNPQSPNPEKDDQRAAIQANGDMVESIVPPPAENLVTIKFQESEGYLFNPGIGWIYRWGRETNPDIPSSVLYSERSDISWQILNPEEGIYNWAPIDRQLNTALNENKQYAFRVYTMIGESYGDHALPQWVIDKGAIVFPSGEPDYSNCIYQEEWGRFVSELVNRYDGNPNIAFVDISGYGNFNEWSWRDDQTAWDYAWEDHYEIGTASPITLSTIDGQARRRLVDMFIGGSFSGHGCRTQNGSLRHVDYAYGGFQNSQLVMPYAGIIQSTQYVFTQRRDVGFRFDCLGRRSSEDLAEKLVNELSLIAQTAPIIFETCTESEFELSSAYRLLDQVPASLIHNANVRWLETEDISDLLLDREIGYKYHLAELVHAASVEQSRELYLKMIWQNLGNSPSFPKMGQEFELHVIIENQHTGITQAYILRADISQWLPSPDQGAVGSPDYLKESVLVLPADFKPGMYNIIVAIHDLRTNQKIAIANIGGGEDKTYLLSQFEVTEP